MNLFPSISKAPPKSGTLFISDLDGTLLTNAGALPDETRHIIQELIAQRGVKFTLCTARSYRRTRDLAKELGVSLPIIVDSGSCIIDPSTDQVLWAGAFPIQTLSAVLNVMEKAHVKHRVHRYVSEGSSRSTSAPTHSRLHKPLNGRPNWFATQVFMVTCDARAIAPEDFTELGASVTIGTTEDHATIEVRPSDTTKGTSARRLAADLNSERVVAFGNSEEDYTLLSLANEGYTIDTSPPELQRIFKPIGSNNSDAVAHWLMARVVSEGGH